MNYFELLSKDLQYYFLKNNPTYFKILINIKPFNELDSVKKFKTKNYKTYIWNTFFIFSLFFSITKFSCFSYIIRILS